MSARGEAAPLALLVSFLAGATVATAFEILRLERLKKAHNRQHTLHGTLSGPHKLYFVRKAVEADIPAIRRVVNEAYLVENGSEGIGFVKDGFFRFPTDESCREVLDDLFVAVRRSDSAVVGSIRLTTIENGQVAWFGPLAVDPSLQKSGIGRLLMGLARTWAQTRGCRSIKIGVVNHRTDLVPYYERVGFALSGEEEEFPHPVKLSRPSHLRIMELRLPSAIDVAPM